MFLLRQAPPIYDVNKSSKGHVIGNHTTVEPPNNDVKKPTYFPPDKGGTGIGKKQRFLGLRMKKKHVKIRSQIVKWCPTTIYVYFQGT